MNFRRGYLLDNLFFEEILFDEANPSNSFNKTLLLISIKKENLQSKFMEI
ncbi:hypothetical protein SAMN05878391_0734 [Salinicoccus kekensis]|uniref:Uncharacterized protein n=1 Tax=Salinicoccus kekensis TaxID=714307 RepID=A0A285UBR4_9STAP|nr:hypothetical protein SAMN05878391_0734 [Salinicoccus kekensis]